VEQTYVGTPSGRRLNPQSYNDTSPFVPIQTLYAQGLTRPFRIKAIYDVILNNDTNSGPPQQCTVVNQNISANAHVSPTYTCAAADIVTGSIGAARFSLLQLRTQQAADYWRSVLQVRPVADAGITIDPSLVSEFNITNNTFVADVDLVLIMTARVSTQPVAGYAQCLQIDQNNRCTVGQFNWIPNLLNLDGINSPVS
jgi:hypothetical protein